MSACLHCNQLSKVPDLTRFVAKLAHPGDIRIDAGQSCCDAADRSKYN